MRDHDEAILHCVSLGTGYRLSELEEIISIVDYSQFDPALPAGHPFSNILLNNRYWSVTTLAGNSTSAWEVALHDGTVAGRGKASDDLVLCVRSGS